MRDLRFTIVAGHLLHGDLRRHLLHDPTEVKKEIKLASTDYTIG